MGLLGLLKSLIGSETEALVQRARESAVAVAAIGLFVLIGLGFLLLALNTWLAAWVGQLWAALIIAGCAFVIAIILFVAMRIQSAAIKRREQARRRQAESNSLVLGAAAAALPELFASPAIRNVGLPIALYAAFLIFSAPRKPRPPAD